MARVGKKLQSMAAVATIVGACVAVGTWLFPTAGGLSLNALQHQLPRMFSPTLIISGSGAKVEIRTSSRDEIYDGGEIDAVGSNHVVYISKDQILRVKVTGAGVSLRISTRTLEQVQIDDLGVGTRLYEL